MTDTIASSHALTAADESDTAEPKLAEAQEPGTDAARDDVDELLEEGSGQPSGRRVLITVRLLHLVAFVLLPLTAMAITAAIAYAKYANDTAAATTAAQIAASAAAKDTAVAMFTYTPDNVEQNLNSAVDLLTGAFRDEYTATINDVAIPGARQYHVTTLVNVPAVSTVHAEPGRVVVMLYINQSVTVGDEPPHDTAFAAKATLDKIDGQWLMSAFDPI
ncbi:hypothetical protein [Mycolicibacterium setense]